MRRAFAILALLAACEDERAATPAPVPLTDEALGHYCLMTVADHGGPKAQIHLEGYPAPIFFTQVRDALAYLRGAERTAPVIAVYVSDMGAAPSWEAPGPDNWIDARQAVFVHGAAVTGGMGAPEIAPFASAEAARAFAVLHGGALASLDEVPEAAVFGGVKIIVQGDD